MIEKILPVIEDICNGGDESSEMKLDLYKILAEISTHKISFVGGTYIYQTAGKNREFFFLKRKIM